MNAQKSSDDVIADLNGSHKRRVPSPAPALRMGGFQNKLVKLKPELVGASEIQQIGKICFGELAC